MKISKAIELITTMTKVMRSLFPPDEQTALAMAIAALTRHQNRDYITCAGMYDPLPGETNE